MRERASYRRLAARPARPALHGAALRAPLGALALGLAGAVHAGGAMVTDDAGLVDPHACQLETLVKSARDHSEYWVMPACDFTGNLELTLAGALTGVDGTSHTSDVQMQGKTQLKPLTSNGWGVALAAGIDRHLHTAPGGQDWYAYVPVSFSFRDDRLLLHTNLGWQRDGASHRDHPTWGIATETQLAANSWLIAETFGPDLGRSYYQVGLRHWLIPDSVQIDTTYGDRLGGGDERWISVCLHIHVPLFGD